MNIIRQVASSMVKFKYMNRIIIYFCIAFGISLADTVYHIPIEGTIDLGLPPYILYYHITFKYIFLYNYS